MSSNHAGRSATHRLVVLDDGHLAPIAEGGYYTPAGGDFYRFAAEFTRRFSTVELCMPVIGRNRCGGSVGAATVVPLFPHGSTAGYLRHFPRALAHNIPVLRRAIADADLVWLRLPAQNGLLAYLIARRRHTPVAMAVVGDVQEAAPHKHGIARLARPLRELGARADWWLTARICRRSLVFAYGTELAAKLRSAGATNVHVTFTSLIGEADFSPAGDCPTTWPGSPLQLLYVGRLAGEKGIPMLLDAAGLIAKDYAVSVDLVGDGPLRAQLTAAAAHCGVPVRLHGYLPPGPRLDDRLSQADVLVLPSLGGEGVPKVLLLAMARRLPVVATATGGIPDVVRHGHTGLLVPPGDPVALAGSIRRLAAEPALRTALADAGQEFARGHTLTAQLDEMAALMTGYLGSKPCRGERAVASTEPA